jgi:hypothetical protein
VRACQTQVVAEVVNQQEARFDLVLMPAAVDRGGNLVLHKLLLNPNGAAASGTVRQTHQPEDVQR